MKNLLVVAVAALITVAMPSFAAEKSAAPAGATTAANTAAPKTMDDCKNAMSACKDDACRAEVKANPVCKDMM